MAKLYIKRLIEKYNYDPKKITGETYRNLITDIIGQNTVNVQKKVIRMTGDYFKGKATGKFKAVKFPDMVDVLPKRAIYFRKAADKGKSITDTLRDKLTNDLRQVLNDPKYLYQRGALKGTLKKQAIDDFRANIKSTFISYKKIGVPGNLENIVKTEIRSATNLIKHEYMKKFEEKNEDLEIIKIWIHNGRFSKVARPHHAAMNGVSIPNDNNFQLFNKKTKEIFSTPHPHWEGLPASEIISCSCELQYEFKKNPVSQGIY